MKVPLQQREPTNWRIHWKTNLLFKFELVSCEKSRW